jgi:hypothetical protein
LKNPNGITSEAEIYDSRLENQKLSEENIKGAVQEKLF